jgi:hypothetical protein
MTSTPALQSGDRVLVGSTLVTVDEVFAGSLKPGDVVLVLLLPVSYAVFRRMFMHFLVSVSKPPSLRFIAFKMPRQCK